MSIELSEEELLEKSLRATLAMTKQMKQAKCEHHNGHADINPFLVFGIEMKDDEGNEGLGGAVIELDLSEGENAVEHLPQVLSEISEQGMRKFLWVMLVCEGYCERNDNNAEKLMSSPDYERGTLEKDFLNNPTSTVSEGIIATVFGWEGGSSAFTQFYKYGDDGLPVYEEENEYTVTYYPKTKPQMGLVPEIMYSFLGYCHLAEQVSNN